MNDKLDKILEKLDELIRIMEDIRRPQVERWGQALAQSIIDRIDERGLIGAKRVAAIDVAYSELVKAQER